MKKNEIEVGKKDRFGDLVPEAPNPINIEPQFPGDYPEPKPTTSKIPEAAATSKNDIRSPGVNHPPRPPDDAMGPFFHFITTDLDNMVWKGSVLIFRHISYTRPGMTFISDVKIDFQWEILYDNIFNLCVYRMNLFIEIRTGEGDEKIIWKIDWGDKKTEGTFYIARCEQKWRGGFFSCNGFDAYVPERVVSNLTYSNVWDHLNSIHEETPLHLLLWGGDQNYIDFIFEDIPFLRAWVNMEWNEKWTTDFRDDLREQVEQYHFNTYIENWYRRSEVKRALASIPSLMMWDDHDIFDGAGSYPPLLHDSPMMMGLFSAAQKMRLLFQHHTTIDKAREHRLFGYQGYNFFARCGRNLAILGSDGRSERTAEIIHHQKSWDMIFDKLKNELDDVEHLIVLFPVPFSFIRVKLAESIFEHLKNLPNRFRQVPLVKQTNSIFNLPELYDDLLDEWTHKSHIEERNRVLVRFQQLAQEKKVRITYFSGDVHCCGIGRFQTKDSSHRSAPIYDAKLMYQIISSAIVNMPPSKNAIRIAHRFRTKWEPVQNTEEEIIDFFQRRPENGRKVFHKKLRPNRNWCYFEQCSKIISATVTVVDSRCFHCFPSKENQIIPTHFGPASNQHGQGGKLPPLHQHTNREQCHQTITTDQQQIGTNDLKIRLWLESTHSESDGRQFAAYDLLIPNLN